MEIKSSVEPSFSFEFCYNCIVFPLLRNWNCPLDWKGHLWDETNSHMWCISYWFVPWWCPSIMGHTNFPSTNCGPWDLRELSHVLTMRHSWKFLVWRVWQPKVKPKMLKNPTCLPSSRQKLVNYLIEKNVVEGHRYLAGLLALVGGTAPSHTFTTYCWHLK